MAFLLSFTLREHTINNEQIPFQLINKAELQRLAQKQHSCLENVIKTLIDFPAVHMFKLFTFRVQCKYIVQRENGEGDSTRND